MRLPENLQSMLDDGTLDEVVRPLMSGKEAQVYLVVAHGQLCVAKVYKEAQSRTFKHRAEYAEGRKTRNTRDQRAMSKRTRHGKAQDEAAWRTTEVDMIYRLHAAGVRVPMPFDFVDGVLLMELITDAEGNPAPRLGDLDLDPEEATIIHGWMLHEVVRMLCAGVVHGDLSPFNILMGPDGPVIIDLPQAVDPSSNQNAAKLLLRDVGNLHRFLVRFVPHTPRLPYGEEMWDLYRQNRLTPETELTGRYHASTTKADIASVLELIEDADHDERRRRDSLGLRGGPRPRDGAAQGRGPGPARAAEAPRAPNPPREAEPARPQRPPREAEPSRPHRPPREPEPSRPQRAPREAEPTRQHRPPREPEPTRPRHDAVRRDAPEPASPPRAEGAPPTEGSRPRRRRRKRGGGAPTPQSGTPPRPPPPRSPQGGPPGRKP